MRNVRACFYDVTTRILFLHSVCFQKATANIGGAMPQWLSEGLVLSGNFVTELNHVQARCESKLPGRQFRTASKS